VRYSACPYTFSSSWAAIAPIAGATAAPAGYPYERLKGMPVMTFHGDADATVPVAATRAMVAAMKEHGLSPAYVEVPGASHGSVVAVAMPKIFEFFAQQSRQARN
jgi:predicted esterase